MRRAGAAINPHPNWHPGHDNRALALDLLCARITAATPKQTAAPNARLNRVIHMLRSSGHRRERLGPSTTRTRTLAFAERSCSGAALPTLSTQSNCQAGISFPSAGTALPTRSQDSGGPPTS